MRLSTPDTMEIIELDEELFNELPCEALTECLEKATHSCYDGICLQLYCPTHIGSVKLIIQVAKDSGMPIKCSLCGRGNLLPDDYEIKKI